MFSDEKLEKIKNEMYEDHIESYMDDEDFYDHFDEIIKTLSQLDDEVTLHRVVFLEDIKDLNKDELGQFWVEDERTIDDDHFQNYLQNECAGEEVKGSPFKIEAIFNKKDVFFEMNINQFLINPKEEEITLYKHAKPIGDIKIYDCEKSQYIKAKPEEDVKKETRRRMKHR